MKQLKYPEKSFIKWNDEYFKVLKNFDDCFATVMDMSGVTISKFYFTYGETAELVTDKEKIKELRRVIRQITRRK